jgi:transposase
MVFGRGSEYGSEWDAICSIAAKTGGSPGTLHEWVRRTEIDTGRRDGITSDERARMRELERENLEIGKRPEKSSSRHQEDS